MQLGAIFPQTEIGADPIAVKDFAQAAESLGYEHLLVFDHVLGADHTQRAEWNRPYNKDDMFHEPFVMFGYLAALTETIEFCTGIIILPQRQTALVAKQTAEVDVLTNGRLRLGIGVGWNEVEFEALGENWENRGRRSAEQIEVLRMLWTQEVVNYEGRYHKITHAGINPLPVQRPIPGMAGRWRAAGGAAHRAYRRRLVPAVQARRRGTGTAGRDAGDGPGLRTQSGRHRRGGPRRPDGQQRPG